MSKNFIESPCQSKIIEFIHQLDSLYFLIFQEEIVIDVPQEICDLNPQKTCRMANKLVPKLTPTQECTLVPKEVCNLTYGPPKVVEKPYLTEWCLDENEEKKIMAAELAASTPETPPEQARSKGRPGRRRRFRNRRRQRNQRQWRH